MRITKVAIQKNGRLTGGSMQYLRTLGLNFNLGGKKLVYDCPGRAVEIILLRDDDIPQLVADGTIDFGIVGKNLVMEFGRGYKIIKELGFGQCSLVLASPQRSGIKAPADFRGKKIATSYPNILGQYLKKMGIQADVVTMSGAVEVAPALGLADGICDITETGNALRSNNLQVITPILFSEAVLIGREKLSLKDSNLLNLCESLTVKKLVPQLS